MIARYRGVSPSPQHVADSKARVAAWAEGRDAEAQVLVQSAMIDVEAYVTRYLAEKNARIAAEKSEADSRAASVREIARLSKELDDQKNAVLKKTALFIVIGSLGIIGLSIAYIVISPNKISALQGAGPAAVVGILGLGLAQLITRPWFLSACAAVAVCGTIALAWWARSKYREGKLSKEFASRAALTQATLSKVVPAIDEAYSKTMKSQLSASRDVIEDLLSRLSSKMNQDEKAEIHATRAANASPTTAAI